MAEDQVRETPDERALRAAVYNLIHAGRDEEDIRGMFEDAVLDAKVRYQGVLDRRALLARVEQDRARRYAA